MKYKAEVFDQVQRLFDVNGFNDHQLHCVLRFDAEAAPDADVLREAVLASIEAYPILGARYVDAARPYWESLDRADLARAFIVARTQAEFDAVLLARANEGCGPQVRVCLVTANPAAIAITLNHMICDAAAFKTYVYRLCDIYSKLTVDPDYRPPRVGGPRSIREVLSQFPLSAKLKSLFSQSGDNNRAGDHRFPMNEGAADAPFIATRRLSGERTAAAKAQARARGATLNDFALTALYRSLFRTLALKPGDQLTIPLMVDMSRYLGERDAYPPLTNLSSMVASQLDYRPNETFDGALGRVKAVMDGKKELNLGLNAFAKLDFLFRIFGDRSAHGVLRKQMRQPLICMTNIGVLDEARLSLADLRPSDGYMCGSIKYKPYFQLAMSTYRGELT